MRLQFKEKPLVWLRGEIKTPPFSRSARLEAGELLGRLQRGDVLAFPQARPMPAIAQGCLELRVRDETVDWRVVACVTKEAIVILEVFPKKTPRTPREVLANCRRRLSSYLRATE